MGQEGGRGRGLLLLVLLALVLGAVSVVLLVRREPAPESATSAATPAAEAATPAEVVAPPGPYVSVREAAVAGSWYPDDPSELAPLVDGFLGDVEPACDDLPEALVSPHAGYRFSGATAGQAYGLLRGCHVPRVWILAPSHKLALRGAAVYPHDAFRTPLGDLPVDTSTSARLAKQPEFEWLPDQDRGEHSLEMQLPLLQRAIGSFELVPILLGQVDVASARRIAEAIRPELGPGDLVVASTDFTHHGPDFRYVPFEEDVAASIDALDHGAWEHLAQPDVQALHSYLEQTGATVCGRNPLKVLAALVGPEARGTELAYTTSGALTGDWRNSVSYLAGRIDGPAWGGAGPAWGGARFVDPEAAAALHELAWRALLHHYEQGGALDVDPARLPEGVERQLGAFVTLNKDGRLRGCIGEIEPVRSAWQAVATRAVDAATGDPRFPRVQADELADLELEVSLLGPSWEVADPSAIIVGRHGVVLGTWPKTATFLPQVGPEQGWGRDELLQHLARKAGLAASQIGSARLAVYEAQVIRGERPE